MRISTPASPCRLTGPITRGVAVPTLSLFLALVAFGCTKKSEPGATSTTSGAATAPTGTYRFAFVTNNSSDFWNIAENGLRKAENDFGVKVDMFRPLQGEIPDPQRFLADIMVHNFAGVSISPPHPAAIAYLRGGRVRRDRHPLQRGGPGDMSTA